MGGLFDFSAVLDAEQEGDYSQVSSAKITDLSRTLKNAPDDGVTRAVKASLVATTGPAFLIGFTVSSVAAQFVLFFDSATLPAENTVPTLSFPVAATGTASGQFFPGRYFRNGIVVCNSSTQHVKTIGSADCLFDVQYL